MMILLFDELEVAAKVLCLVGKGFFDAHELVVFADAVGAAGTAGLDEASVERDDEVGDGGVLGFARAVGDDGGVAIAGGKADSVDSLREGTNLIEFDEDGVGNLAVETHLETLHIGDEEVVATSWHLSPMRSVISFQPSQSSSAMPSSMEMTGYWLTQRFQNSTISWALYFSPVDQRIS